MKYFEADFQFHSATVIHHSQLDVICDLCADIAAEAGFESFEETTEGLKGYVQQALFDEKALSEALADFPIEGITVSYTVNEVEDRDWNEAWENEGFEPIIVNSEKRTDSSGKPAGLIIHDGRHLPDSSLVTAHSSLFISIEIDAHQAFGTGTHETTRMVCATLLEQDLKGLRTLDCGCGTGILSICALKLGAREAVGYDIDEWSADNARHNAVINLVDQHFESLLGDATILNKVEGTFDVVMANINRNILLADMPMFREKMAPGALMILSGFYTADSPLLIEKAQSLGLQFVSQKCDNDWACLLFSYSL